MKQPTVAGPFTAGSLSSHRVVATDDGGGGALVFLCWFSGLVRPPDLNRWTRSSLDALDEVEAAEGTRHSSSLGSGASDVGSNPARRGTGWMASPSARNDVGGTVFAQVVLDHLRTAGVQKRDREDRITSTSLAPGVIDPKFGTLSRPELVAAAREALDAGFDLLIASDARASELSKLGALQVLRATRAAHGGRAQEYRSL